MPVVFFADILGFSALSRVAGAEPAVDALSDLAAIFSTQSDVARYLQSPTWRRRYGLSDSIFLVADDPREACAAAADLFFNLAFYNSRVDNAVLLRGAITSGDVREIGPLFPETAKFNLVGEAVVRAVRLESVGVKGPRLLVSGEVADALTAGPTESVSWILDRTDEGYQEFLWVLPPDSSTLEPLLIADVSLAASQLLVRGAGNREAVAHLAAHVDLVARSLRRLRERDPSAAALAFPKTDLDAVRRVLESLRTSGSTAELIAQRIATIIEEMSHPI